MSATLRLTHKAIRMEVRRGSSHLPVRNGRSRSRNLTFHGVEGQVVSFRCTGKRLLSIFLVSFVVPRLALSLRPE
jgi:hypothetical protein